MSKLCTKCGQVIEDNISTCPYCGKEVENVLKEENNISDIIEIPVVNQTDNSTVDGTIPLVMSAPTLDDIKPTNINQAIDEITITEAPTSVEEVVPVAIENVLEEPQLKENTEIATETVVHTDEQPVEEQIEIVTEKPAIVDVRLSEKTNSVNSSIINEIEVTLSPQIVEEVEKEKLEIPPPEVNITTTPVIVETAPNLGDVNEILTIVETEVENKSLETISIDASADALVEEEEVFEIPVMPEPTIGEINPELLGSKYDNEEQANNKKIETKKKLEEEEHERKVQEELAKREIPMERPDLLAGFGQSDLNLEIDEPKKKKSGGGKIVIAIIVILAVVGIAIWFLLSGGLDKILNKEPENSYIDPVNEYYNGYNNSDSEKMINSFISCLASSDIVTNVVNNSLNVKNQNTNLKVTFKETSVEVVNKDDQKHLDKHLLDNCATNVPDITDYKHIFIEQKTKLNTDSNEEKSNLEFWVAEVKEKWYIIMIQ